MSMKTRNPRRRSGFTLLELVVVLSILAVLTTVAMRSVSQIEDSNRCGSVVHDIEKEGNNPSSTANSSPKTSAL